MLKVLGHLVGLGREGQIFSHTFQNINTFFASKSLTHFHIQLKDKLHLEKRLQILEIIHVNLNKFQRKFCDK